MTAPKMTTPDALKANAGKVDHQALVTPCVTGDAHSWDATVRDMENCIHEWVCRDCGLTHRIDSGD